MILLTVGSLFPSEVRTYHLRSLPCPPVGSSGAAAAQEQRGWTLSTQMLSDNRPPSSFPSRLQNKAWGWKKNCLLHQTPALKLPCMRGFFFFF